MELTKNNTNHLLKTMEEWEVPKDWVDPVFNYLVYGYEPGSFFTSILANDMMGAVGSSHPSNTFPALKNLCGWIQEYCPLQAKGSYHNVSAWCHISDADRRIILENKGLLLTEQEEIMGVLHGNKIPEPVFY